MSLSDSIEMSEENIRDRKKCEMDSLEEIKNALECYIHSDAHLPQLGHHIKYNMVKWLISETERLRKSLADICEVNKDFSIMSAFGKYVITKNIAEQAIKEQ